MRSQESFRPDIQGLRAFAVLVVIVYHLWPLQLRGGFTGVDIFFVISGFIITRLLLREHAETGTIHLPSFWARRIRRLLPAATLVLAACLVVTVLWLPRTLWGITGTQILASALYVQNWALAFQSIDYAGQRQASTIVQHYWSLAIEEQFYIFWPPLAAAAGAAATRFKLRLPLVAGLLAGGIFGASLASLYLGLFEGPAAYFVSTSRAWELAAGCVLASLPCHRIPNGIRVVYSWTGMTLLVSGVFLIPGTGGYPNWTALLPALGALLLIAAGDAGNWSWYPVLGWGPLRFIGDISYSLYLWHWPLIAFWPGDLAVPGLTRSGTIALFSLGLAVIVKILVEDPIRVHSQGRVKGVWKSYLLGALLVGIVAASAGCLIQYQEQEKKAALEEIQVFRADDPLYPGAAAMDPERALHPEAQPVKPNPIFAQSDLPALYTDGCEAKQTAQAVPCEYGNHSGTVTIALMGDSHAAQYLPALELLAKAHNWRLLVFEKAACIVHPMSIRFRATGLPKYECDSWKKSAMAQLLSAKPDAVVIAAAMPNIYDDFHLLPPMAEQIEGHKQILKQLTDSGIRVGVIRDNPRPMWDVPTCVLQNPRCEFPRTAVLDAHADALFQAAHGSAEVSAVDLSSYFCKAESCPAVIGNVLVYRDGDHLTASYAKTLAPYLDGWLQRWIRSEQKRSQPPAKTREL